MIDASPAPFAHRAWFTTTRVVGPEMPVMTIGFRQVTHYLAYMVHGTAAVRWIHRGRERRFVPTAGTVRFSPADGARHTLIGTHASAHHQYTVFALRIPPSQFRHVAGSEGIESSDEFPQLLRYDDPVLRSCMATLAVPTLGTDRNEESLRDNAARRLILRILALGHRRLPDWHLDSGVFDRRTVADLVVYIDEHLRNPPSAADMGLLTSLTPSHFARKFRRSIGLSLHRFVNYRRIEASLRLLKDGEVPLASVALDLGFSSQSHFTRLFSELTGMTPAKYRSQYRRTVG